MFGLFADKYKEIREEQFVRSKQDETLATFRLAKEMIISSKIELDRNYLARELLNLLRIKLK